MISTRSPTVRLAYVSTYCDVPLSMTSATRFAGPVPVPVLGTSVALLIDTTRPVPAYKPETLVGCGAVACCGATTTVPGAGATTTVPGGGALTATPEDVVALLLVGAAGRTRSLSA